MNTTKLNKAFNVVLPAITKTVSYDDSEIHNAFVVNSTTEGYTFSDDDRPERIIKSFFAATAAHLGKAKTVNEDEATALILTDPSGQFMFGAVAEYHINEENPDEPGNWSLIFTFNESDIKDIETRRKVKKLLYSDQAFFSTFDTVGYDVACLKFSQDRYMYDACMLAVSSIKQVLDNEALEDDEFTIELPGYFTATVVVENDEKIYSIVPDGHIKAILKDDSALDKI